MRRIGAWLVGSSSNGSVNGSTFSVDPAAWTLQEELKMFDDALQQTHLIMNDEIELAETMLKKQDTPFHKLGLGFSYFLQSIAGFNKDVMAGAIQALNDCETTSSEYHKRALRSPKNSYQSKIYPPGSEYALCMALSQMMGAIGGIWNENVTEGIRGSYKLRKALATFQSLKEAEDRFVASHARRDQSHPLQATTSPMVDPVDAGEASLEADATNDHDDLDFHDTEEEQPHVDSTISDIHATSSPSTDFPKIDDTASHSSADQASPSAAEAAGVTEEDFRSLISDEPIDVFIHTGTSLCLGMVNVILSLIPPSLGRVLAIFSIKGDREAGLAALWSAASIYQNLLGAIAAVALLSVYNAAIAPADIYTEDEIPFQRMNDLVAKLRKTYPESRLFALEEARTAASSRDIDTALRILSSVNLDTPLKAAVYIALHEKGMGQMALQQYEASAQTFLDTIKVNESNHNFYYYAAVCNFIELYHLSKHDPETAQSYEQKVQDLMSKFAFKSRKGLFKGPRPFDTFLQRKLAKWNARSTATGCSLIDAITVSPTEEICYGFGGYRRMQASQLDASLKRLAQWEAYADDQDDVDGGPIDERALRALMRAGCLRNQDRTAEAQEILADRVLCYTPKQIKVDERSENVVLPLAHYELGCCFWQDAGRGEVKGERADVLLRKCKAEIETAARWEHHDLSPHLGIRIATAREVLRRRGIV